MDVMDALENLLGRYSTPAKLLTEPAPNDAELETLFAAAVTAPDHCNLQPWRFLVIRGNARRRLGDTFVEAYKLRDPNVTAAQLENYRLKPLRAPLIVAVIADLQIDNAKVPVQEQLISAGVAAQHIQLAARALGYHSIWLTGINSYDLHVSSAMGLDFDEKLVGFIYLGSAQQSILPPERPKAQQLVSEWTQAKDSHESVI